MVDEINKALRSLEYLLGETQRKISQIQNGEFSDDIVEDLALRDYADYFDATIVAVRGYIFSIDDVETIKAEFQKLSSINISGELKHKPFSFFSLFNDYFDGRNDLAKNKFNNKIFERIKTIEARCSNLIYLLKIRF